MNMRLTTCIILGALALPAFPQSSVAPEILLLSRIKRHTAADLAHLPNFTCLETIERSTRYSPLKPFDVKDVIRVEVAHLGERELFAWPGASNFENESLPKMIGSGMTSEGEYASHARSVFTGETAVIHYVGEEEIGGHRAARYDYGISKMFSGYTVHANGDRVTVGVHGAFWADTTTFDLLRLTVEGTEIPDQLGIRGLLTDIEYGRLQIGSGNFLLPQSSSVWMGLNSGIENRNRIDFTHCRQYLTESVISFGEPSAASLKPGAASRQVFEFTLPAGLTVSLRLESPIRFATAKVGDPVSATIDANLKQGSQVLAPKGAIVSGRLRMLQNDGERYIAGLEFTDLAFENKHARFLAKLVSVDSRFRRSSMLRELPPELPGVGTFLIPAGVAQLAKGMLMEWKTLTFEK
jgi:hypothetical protein